MTKITRFLKNLIFKIRFYFSPLIVGVDYGTIDGDYTSFVYAKKLDGKIYIIKEVRQ